MEIIIELSLCINLIANAFIVKSTGLFLKIKPKWWFLTTCIGSAFAMVLPLLHMAVWLQVLAIVLLCCLLVSLSFPYRSWKQFAMAYGTFVGVTFVFGGACYAVESLFGQVSLCGVLGVLAAIQVCMYLIFKNRNRLRTIETFTYRVKIQANGQTVEEEGYLDSGNMLIDPITQKPIILINFEVFSKLYQNINYLNAYLKKLDVKQLTNGHYIKINSIASGSRLLVFTADELQICRDSESHAYENVAVGLSFSGFEKALGKKVLLHSEFI